MNSWVDSVLMGIETKLEKILWGVILGIHLYLTSRTMKGETWENKTEFATISCIASAAEEGTKWKKSSHEGSHVND